MRRLAAALRSTIEAAFHLLDAFPEQGHLRLQPVDLCAKRFPVGDVRGGLELRDPFAQPDHLRFHLGQIGAQSHAIEFFSDRRHAAFECVHAARKYVHAAFECVHARFEPSHPLFESSHGARRA